MTETTKPSSDTSAPPRRSPEWFLAVALTAAIVLLHGYFLTRAGGLWRDEINSVSIARGGWSQIGQDSFPFLFPTLLHVWIALGLGETDSGLRIFGALAGLSLTAAAWLAAWWLRRLPPLWSLVLVALNAWVIYYDTSLRAYGLGSAMIALCGAAAWNFLERPGRKSWLLFALTAILSVQTLYQNTALVAAVCAGACAVCVRQKKIKLAGGIFLGGLVAAISLLPYAHSIWGITQSSVLVRTDFNYRSAVTDLGTLLAFPLTQFFWVWSALVGWVVLRAGVGLFPKWRDDRAIFSAVTLVVGFFTFMIFLRVANFFVQPWYFLPLLALAAVALENALPRLAGKFRSLLWGGVLATALVSASFSVRVLDYRFTNLDTLAKKVSAAAQKKDFAIVKRWTFGITFDRYFDHACDWTTIPPLADHTLHRYDQFAVAIQNTNCMIPVLEQAAGTLRSGNAVWIIGNVDLSANTNSPTTFTTGNWSDQTGYEFNNQLNNFISQHSREIQCIDAGTNDDVNFNERTALFKVSGWKESP